MARLERNPRFEAWVKAALWELSEDQPPLPILAALYRGVAQGDDQRMCVLLEALQRAYEAGCNLSR